MSSQAKVAEDYLHYLENGEVSKVIGLFSAEGMVQSPLYGLMPAKEFYTALAADTTASKLTAKGIFEKTEGKELALYFTYQWTLKSGEEVSFDVVDILEFDTRGAIKKLTIIYDTVQARVLKEALT
ncbi:conserved hypothetical protein [Tenacibaculum litopenaei]|jgi:hypothetical protein|uniref:nuclear transport factor 2 family protein n=1 Tax=Tenacibaculum litopenaei TaxID=396016 RepID=UPI0038938A4D